MSLESDVHDVRKFAKELRSMKTVTSIEAALESALQSVKEAEGAEKRLGIAREMLERAETSRRDALNDMEAAKGAAEAMIASAKADASKIREESKAKGAAAVAKATDKADAIAKEAAIANEKFAAAQASNQEILGMLQAQVSHGEQKLAEIRQSLKSITSLTGV